MAPPDACDCISAELWTTPMSPHPGIPGRGPPRARPLPKNQLSLKFPKEPLGLVGPEMALI